MVMKELIFNSFYCWEGVVVLKEPIYKSFYFRRCGGHDKTDFNSFYFGRVWWS